MIEKFLWNQWAVAALFAFLLSIAAAVADQRRRRRANLDRVGFMPWTTLTVLPAMIALFCVAVAIQTW